MVRCFIGIMVPKEIKPYIIKIQEKLGSLPIDVKFVESENIHVTLSFLGEMEQVTINMICEKLDKVCNKYQKFDLEMKKINLIPNENFVRVITFDIEKNENLEKIINEIKIFIGGDVKPPHLTLCRVKNKIERGNIEFIKMIESKIIFSVNSIFLLKSELRETGPIYEIIHESKLGN